MGRSIKFEDIHNRNRFIADHPGEGWRKRSARNVQLSPDYVADYSGLPNPNGFGGNGPVYFPILYIAEAIKA